MKLGDLTLRQLRAICESMDGGHCDLICPIGMICYLANNDLKRTLDDEVDEEKIKNVKTN